VSTTFKSNLPEVAKGIEEATKKAVAAGAAKLHELTVKNLKQQGHGRIYRIPGTKTLGRGKTAMGRARFSGYAASGTLDKASKRLRSKFYVASAPGEYPAVRLGDLSGPRGILLTLKKEDTSWLGLVHSPLAYAAALESKKSAKGRRPFLSRTWQENEKAIQDAVNHAVATEMQERMTGGA